jgi:hypothetical protein
VADFNLTVEGETLSRAWRDAIVHLPDRIATHCAPFTRAEVFMRYHGLNSKPAHRLIDANESAAA